MKTLFLDLGMGAAGDMLSAALLELTPDPQGFVKKLNEIGIPGVEYRAEPTEKCGIRGTHLRVLVHGEEEAASNSVILRGSEESQPDSSLQAPQNGMSAEAAAAHQHTHHHSHPADIAHLVREHLSLPEKVKSDVLAVYDLLAEAESKAHGVPVSEIHFHEVGTKDALADISAVCLLLHTLAPDEILASPVRVGFGQVHCAHGILPVPAPATANLLQGVPIYAGDIRGELCTPTGAALLKHFVTRFGTMPVLTPSAIGYGMGTKDFPAANCVRAVLGETAQQAETVVELRCNLDDMTAEEIGFAMERLLDKGALDVYTAPIGMKKNRPGTLLCVLCRPEHKHEMLSLLLRHTTTLGVRGCAMPRYALSRRFETVQTPYGDVQKKIAEDFGVRREKIEYEDLARIARERNCSLAEIRALLEADRK